jgi:uncharacterized protein (TIGR03435 family)
MRTAILCAGLIVSASCAAFGQGAAESPTFEVASVKPAEPQPEGMMRVRMSGGPGTPDPGQLTYTNVSLKNVLINAYDVNDYQISGPNWLDRERFDIVAKIPQGTTKEQFRLMLQSLLAERFKLALHHETKELPMYALVLGKGGSKLKEAVEEDATTPQTAVPPPPPPPGRDEAAPVRLKMDADGMPQLPSGMGRNGVIMMTIYGSGGLRTRMVCKGQPVSALLATLSSQMGRPVVDATNLKGKYDITLDYAPDGLNGSRIMMPPPPPQHDGGDGGGPPMASAPDAGGPTIFTALQEQLGLKLEQRKGPVDLLVIDRVEKVPTEN